MNSRKPVRIEWLEAGWFSPRFVCVAAGIFVAVLGLQRATGCGPDFPNWLLSEGDEAILAAPQGNFAAELARVNLSRSTIEAVPAKTGYFIQSTEAEVADLRKALEKAGSPAVQTARICAEHHDRRMRLGQFIDEWKRWEWSHPQQPEPTGPAAAPVQSEQTMPVLSQFDAFEGLPDEFADYFEGLLAWHNPAVKDKQIARAAWERLLARRENERRYKSTWAAFMLGKSWEESNPEKAVEYFKRVRDLVRQGCHDSIGLAAASLGLQARVCLHQKRFEAAIHLYLDQLASGDPTATNSLAFAAEQAMSSDPESLRSLARNPRIQKVITAFLISRRSYDRHFCESEPDSTEYEPAQRGNAESDADHWLQAVEEAGVRDIDSVEALALAAYRANRMDAAERWIKRAQGSLLAQWIQAKLLLRAGKLESAAALLASISPLFPIIHEWTNTPAALDRKDTLSLGYYPYSGYLTSAARHVQGELGVLQLSRGEYVRALDSLLNAGFWMDAAYVAERVLTLDELKDYIDRCWPPASDLQLAEEQRQFGERDVSPAKLREQIRYLLARRLTREQRVYEARAYYPTNWVSAFDELARELHAGWDNALNQNERAIALFRAAKITQTNGMELIGTELAPDWHYHDGQFDFGVTGDGRNGNKQARLVRPTSDELRRNEQHKSSPEQRFHYRYKAAALAWEAAKLLPDNDDFTAYVLWQGGSFLKYRDPETANIFYKALVRRNRNTTLGAEADRRRWFPPIDENGNIVPVKPK